MDSGILNSIGGLGLFLLGMVILTNGLKELAGDSVRRMIARFTKSLPSGIATGAFVTAILQSSSATTVTAVGFAGAGLLTLSQALGIVFGANLGTTITGWIVALFGFEFKLGLLAYPLVLIGVLLKLFARKRTSAAGLALAGFGLIFIGIDGLQGGMAGMADVVTPASFPQDNWSGRLLLILIGIGITLVTQSSSAGVAMALTAVHAGTISLAQAGAMVIGFDVGTTFTALMASFGGSVAARRTALAHLFYNLVTGAAAYFLLPVYVWSWEQYWNPGQGGSAEIALVAFHSLFNCVGLLLVIPFTEPFSRLITRVVPDKMKNRTERLEESLIQTPNVAIEAARATIVDVFLHVLGLYQRLFSAGIDEHKLKSDLNQSHETLETTADYLRRVNVSEADEETMRCYQETLLALDHCQRLMRRFEDRERLKATQEVEQLSQIVEQLKTQIDTVIVTLKDRTSVIEEAPLEQFSQELDADQKESRRRFTQTATRSGANFDLLLVQLDAYRWLSRISYHLWRGVHHLQEARIIVDQKPAEPDAGETESKTA